MAGTIALVHHAHALDAGIDPQRPLSSAGLAHARALAEQARDAGIVPETIWHSGKLRAKQTAEAFYTICNPLADFRMVRGIRPDDDAAEISRELLAETRDVMVVSHWPLLPALLATLAPDADAFPLHGIVVLAADDAGMLIEVYRGS